MTLRVVVLGGGGYVGGELLRLLLHHPDVSEVLATSRSQAGKQLGDVHPQLVLRTDVRFSGATPAEASRGRDVVFLCLEHGESSQVAAEVFGAGPGLVVDLAADFRIQDRRLYERYYGRHAAPESVSRFTYGLADVRGKDLHGALAIAAPGCFATAAQLALYPLRTIALAGPPALFGITGSSGAGVAPKPTTHHPARAHNVFAYSVLGHRHDAEIVEQWRGWTHDPDASPRLMAHSGPFVRGIYLTLYAHAESSVDSGRLHAALNEAYGHRPFVRVMDHPPELTHVLGSNVALIHGAVGPDGREIQISVALDNLVKGAGGQAVQAMNLALGLEETAGLLAGGVFPC